MKLATLTGSALLFAALLPLAGCDKPEEAEAETEQKEEIPNIKVGLPPPPNFDDARAPKQWEDGSYSIFGLRSDIDERVKEGDNGTEIEIKGWVQEIYVPPECAEDDPFCDLGKQPHFWITDKEDTKGKKRAMMVVNYAFKIQDYEADMWKDAPQIALEIGKQYKFKGKFKRFSDTGFAHDSGLLEFVAVWQTDPEAGTEGWVYPPGAPWHPTAVAAMEEQQRELAEKAAAALDKKKAG